MDKTQGPSSALPAGHLCLLTAASKDCSHDRGHRSSCTGRRDKDITNEAPYRTPRRGPSSRLLAVHRHSHQNQHHIIGDNLLYHPSSSGNFLLLS